MNRIGFAACLTLLIPASAVAQQPFAYKTDLAEARRLAKEEGRPLLVVFR